MSGFASATTAFSWWMPNWRRRADAVRAALARFDGQPQYIFNTHFHGDHIGGNRAFGQHATILGPRQCSQTIGDGR